MRQAALPKDLRFTFVRDVHWFPDIRLEFAIQAIFADNLRLPILNRLATYSQRD